MHYAKRSNERNTQHTSGFGHTKLVCDIKEPTTENKLLILINTTPYVAPST